ncbi:MAG: hypothetical protein KDK37_14695, partial [Leptospiraceae bacterium]|nr:hypothetical protein [Leptospiraceae bacterium]
MKYFTYLRRLSFLGVIVVATGLSSIVRLEAEEPLQQDVPFLGSYMHRVQFDIGVGWAFAKQNIMTESGPAWLLNSALNSGSTGQPPAIPVGEGDENQYWPVRTVLLYSYGDRFDVNYRRSTLNRKYTRDNSPSVLFLFPENSTYVTSIFEGTRLLRYRYDSRIYDFGYYHRWMEDFRLGPIVGYQDWHEDMTVSYGSYTLRGNTPPDIGLTTWAPAGDVRLNYHLNGFLYGLGLKWDPLQYLRVTYQLYFVNRSGTFEGAGPQLLNFRDRNGVESADFSTIYQSGSVTDKGMLHRIEAEFRYCRLSATIGLEREDWTRTYSDFYGFQLGTLTNVSQKSSNLGLGERSTKSKGYRTEVYLKVGMAFHFGDINQKVEESSPA